MNDIRKLTREEKIKIIFEEGSKKRFNLRGADLSGADLSGVKLEVVKDD